MTACGWVATTAVLWVYKSKFNFKLKNLLGNHTLCTRHIYIHAYFLPTYRSKLCINWLNCVTFAMVLKLPSGIHVSVCVRACVCVCPRRIHCATSVRVYEIIIITAVAVACWYAILTSSNAVWPLLRLPCFSPPTNSCGHIRKSNLVWSMTIQTHFLRNALTRCVCV